MNSARVRVVPVIALIVLALAVIPATAMAAEPTVNLGTTAGFAVLAGSTITNTGTTTITGDVGLHPGSAFVDTGVTLIGTRHIADAVAAQAKVDLVTAYNDAAGRPVTSTQPVDLGGLTLGPGVYDTGGVIGITGTLTLDAQGDPDAVFIFKSTATLITASASRVQLINGARFCRVFWVVPSSATLATGSTFVGHIFAMADIQVQTGAQVEGQLLARTGQVTLDTNVITNEICAPARLISITKTASPSSLPAGPGTVKYTYLVTNPGTVELNDVTVTDDKISAVPFASGDANGDAILQPGETWVYTATGQLSETTTNVAIASGLGAGVLTTDTASVTVSVGAGVSTTDTTSVGAGASTTDTTSVVPGALLPDTATPWYGILLAGIALILLGAVGYSRNRIRD